MIFVIEAQCVYCEVRTKYLYSISYTRLGLRRCELLLLFPVSHFLCRERPLPQPKYFYLLCPHFINARRSGCSSAHSPPTLICPPLGSFYEKSRIHPPSHVTSTGHSAQALSCCSIPFFWDITLRLFPYTAPTGFYKPRRSVYCAVRT